MFAVDDIREVVVVEQVATREGVTSDYALLYAVITRLDLDTHNTQLFVNRKW